MLANSLTDPSPDPNGLTSGQPAGILIDGEGGKDKVAIEIGMVVEVSYKGYNITQPRKQNFDQYCTWYAVRSYHKVLLMFSVKRNPICTTIGSSKNSLQNPGADLMVQFVYFWLNYTQPPGWIWAENEAESNC